MPDNVKVRERFDWNLSCSYVSPSIFARKFVDETSIPESNYEDLKNQILDQIILHIEKNTFFPRVRSSRIDLEEYLPPSMNGQVFEKGMKLEDFAERKTARQRKLDSFRSESTKQTRARCVTLRKDCAFCNYNSNSHTIECKRCRIPFFLFEELNIETIPIRTSMLFYSVCMNEYSFLRELNIVKKLNSEDFQSVAFLKNRFLEIIREEEHFTNFEEELFHLEDILDSLEKDFAIEKYTESSYFSKLEETMDLRDEKEAALVRQATQGRRGRPRKFYKMRDYLAKRIRGNTKLSYLESITIDNEE